MKSYVFIAMVICSIIIYPFEAKSQDSGDLRIKSVTLVDGTVISAQIMQQQMLPLPMSYK